MSRCYARPKKFHAAIVSLLSIKNVFVSLHLLYLKAIFLNSLKIDDCDPENPSFSSLTLLNFDAAGYSPGHKIHILSDKAVHVCNIMFPFVCFLGEANT
jgi:hypothetical protein